jgi:Predicted ornithine cyclodeaminase, mu-crystallin homolog
LARSLDIKDKEIMAKNDLKEALNDADTISCATLSQKPLIMGDWIKPGQHLDLVGSFTPDMSEADSKAIAMSKIVVDTYEGALSESGELINALKEGSIKKKHILSDLRELVMGKKNIRNDTNDITLFKSVGTALEDLAAAQLVIEKNLG